MNGTVVITGYLGLIVGAAFALPASLLIQWSLSPEAQATLDSPFGLPSRNPAVANRGGG